MSRPARRGAFRPARSRCRGCVPPPRTGEPRARRRVEWRGGTPRGRARSCAEHSSPRAGRGREPASPAARGRANASTWRNARAVPAAAPGRYCCHPHMRGSLWTEPGDQEAEPEGEQRRPVGGRRAARRSARPRPERSRRARSPPSSRCDRGLRGAKLAGADLPRLSLRAADAGADPLGRATRWLDPARVRPARRRPRRRALEDARIVAVCDLREAVLDGANLSRRAWTAVPSCAAPGSGKRRPLEGDVRRGDPRRRRPRAGEPRRDGFAVCSSRGRGGSRAHARRERDFLSPALLRRGLPPREPRRGPVRALLVARRGFRFARPASAMTASRSRTRSHWGVRRGVIRLRAARLVHM